MLSDSGDSRESIVPMDAADDPMPRGPSSALKGAGGVTFSGKGGVLIAGLRKELSWSGWNVWR